MEPDPEPIDVDPDSLRGKLLIASPALEDPNFDRTVVLITEHGEEGAMGIVLNRPSESEVAAVIPELEAIAGCLLYTSDAADE